jgi:DNA-binding transcriptional regulator YhcF (GntR family)
MIEFRLDGRTGVTTYLQLVHQVRHALRLGHLRPGDQLPTIREVVAKLAINPNTVLKAYRDLEREGLVTSRPGAGTFVREDVQIGPRAGHAALRSGLARWMQRAREAGLDDGDLRALFEDAVQQDADESAAEAAP